MYTRIRYSISFTIALFLLSVTAFACVPTSEPTEATNLAESVATKSSISEAPMATVTEFPALDDSQTDSATGTTEDTVRE